MIALQPASVGLALLMILWSLIPATVKSRVRTYARKTLFRPKVKLLSEEEYQAQASEHSIIKVGGINYRNYLFIVMQILKTR